MRVFQSYKLVWGIYRGKTKDTIFFGSLANYLLVIVKKILSSLIFDTSVRG